MMIIDYDLKKHHYKIQLAEKLILLFSVVILILIELFHLDFMIADYIYELIQWKNKQSFIFETIMHKSTKITLIIVYLGMVVKLYLLIKNKAVNSEIYDLFILLITIIATVALVSLLKRFFNVDCPWDLMRYGGDKEFFSLFNYPEKLLPSSHCFPASHASVGFSWIALFFYLRIKKRPYKYPVLIIVLFMGLSFGLAQQIRGAHFLSHDIWSLIICVLTSILFYKMAYEHNL